MKLLIVDDETKIRSLIRKYAEFDGFEVEEASDGMQAVTLCALHSYDLVIMDIMMPELDGFSAIREIRKKSDVPVIILSARGEEYDKIHGFDLGIDDYVVKPFSPKELMLRVTAILNRTKPKNAKTDDVFVFEDLKVDFAARIVSIDNQRINLSPKEFELLFYLIRNRNLALSRDQLINSIWGIDFYGDDRTLDTHIKLLRKSLGRYADRIVTLRGVGYRFEA